MTTAFRALRSDTARGRQADAAGDALRAAAIRGLSGTPRTLPCKFLYDERGARLFERICELDEYYPTRTEMVILQDHLEEIRWLAGARVRIVELGSGSGLKTRLLLHALEAPAEYVPIDISAAQLVASADALRREFPGLAVQPLCTDYMAEVVLPRPRTCVRRSVAFFPGSTIGNFEPGQARGFLARIGRLCGPDGALLIGVDLKKSRARLELAYNDAQGVTAAFNLNLLHRLNRECGADFDPASFEHRAVYDDDHGRIEMHLVSRRRQTVRMRDAHGVTHEFVFRAGENIVTEHSYKYTVEEFTSLAADAGYVVARSWLDEDRLFSVHWLEPAGAAG